MKIFEKLVFLVLFANMAYANVVFSEVLYNPAGSDGDREWIEFYNNGSSVSVDGWKLEEGGSYHSLSAYQGDFLIDENEFFLVVDSPVDFLLDYSSYSGTILDSVFSLSNAGEYLALNDGLNLIDELNYSDIISEGYTFFNFNLSGNWGEGLVEGGTPGYYDVVEDEPSPEGNESEEIVSEVNINNVAPEIVSFSVYPDEGILEGVQVFPDVTGKNITINAVVTDNNSDDLNVNVNFEKEVVLVSLEDIGNYSNYTWNVFMGSYDEAKMYDIGLVVDDGNESVNDSVSFEYMGLMYIEFSKGSLNFGNVNPGEVSGVNDIEVLNKGNVDVELSVSGSDLNGDGGVIPISSVEAFFDVLGQWRNLIGGFLGYEGALAKGENSTKTLDFRFNAPVGIKADNYTGTITVMGG